MKSVLNKFRYLFMSKTEEHKARIALINHACNRELNDKDDKKQAELYNVWKALTTTDKE